MKKATMKKFFAAALVILMALSFTACSLPPESRETTVWTRTLNQETWNTRGLIPGQYNG